MAGSTAHFRVTEECFLLAYEHPIHSSGQMWDFKSDSRQVKAVTTYNQIVKVRPT